MGIIKKNPNEINYVGGKKHWTDVIKNTGPADCLIWKQPEEDFNNNSTLIVMPGEIALFVNGGIIEEVFEESGTFTLNTANYPFISRLKNQFSGGISKYNCIVYFVRTNHSQEILWGTSSPLQIRDKYLGIITKIKARGSYRVQVENAPVFLKKMVGSGNREFNPEDLDRYFTNEFQSLIRNTLTNVLNDVPYELIEVERNIKDLSNQLEQAVQEIMLPYGLKCIRFIIAALEVDDDELRRKYDDKGIDLLNQVRQAKIDNDIINSMGDNYTRRETAQILHELANNPAAGGIASTGAGLGMGIAATNVFANMANNFMSPVNSNPITQTVPATSLKPSGRFGIKEDDDVQNAKPTVDDDFAVLSKLKTMLESGLISQSQYDAKVEEILSRL
ncbi:MAG: SPFH domain-containing protein [Erysipelotrichaceae bacterium]|nr:SPFH domain-containing protein [Erysipelotrichaceae bacterium]